jgi:hypothetical protein
MTSPEVPNFANWTTSRIKTLLADYRSDLSSCRVLMGKHHQETELYQKWVDAMETELAKRSAL